MALREEIKMYRVEWYNEEIGIGETNQDGFNTREEAQTYCDNMLECFPQYEYYVESYVHYEYTRGVNQGISGGIDGWEDIYDY